MRAAGAVTRFILLFLICATARAAAAGAPSVRDVFGRDVSTVGLTLTDWDGYIANPAIEFSIAPPPGAALPVKVIVTAPEPRMYFDLPSEAGAHGPRKVMTLAAPEKQFAWVSIFPAHKKRNFDTALHIELSDARAQHWELTVPIHVVASETDDHSPMFPISVDFSQDKTGFFKDEAHRAVVEQAARD